MKILSGQCRRQSKLVSTVQCALDLAPAMAELCSKTLGQKKSALALAHCQVDHDDPRRFFVLNDGRIVINPKIIKTIGDPFMHLEGCMSYAFRPDKKVKRFDIIQVEYTDSNGDLVNEVVHGLEACIFQHEIDHMNGKSIYS